MQLESISEEQMLVFTQKAGDLYPKGSNEWVTHVLDQCLDSLMDRVVQQRVPQDKHGFGVGGLVVEVRDFVRRKQHQHSAGAKRVRR